MKRSPLPIAPPLARNRRHGAGPAPASAPAHAATPRDTLVVAFAFDDIITMDPAEAFEISAGEIMGNTYDRLVRFDVTDPSKLYGDVAKSWTVVAGRQDLQLRVEAGTEVRVGQRADRRGRRVFAAARGAARQDAGLHPDPVRLHQGQREGPDQADGAADADARDRQVVCADLRAQLPDGERRRHRRQEARAVEGSRTTTWATAGSRPTTPAPARSSSASGAPTKSSRSSATTTTTARNPSCRASSTGT